MIRTIITALFLGVFFLISLPAFVLIKLVWKYNEKKAGAMAQRMVSWALSVISVICGIKLEVEGLKNIPDEPVLYIGNHSSFFDIVVTYPLLPQTTGYIGKKEIDKISLLRWWMPLLHGLTFDRDDPRQGMKMIIAAIDQVKAGYSMFIFPEGTRSKDGTLHDFKAGSFKIATRTNCPVIPVAISGTADIFENHTPFIEAGTVKVVFGEPVYPDKLPADEKKKIAKLVKSRIESMLD